MNIATQCQFCAQDKGRILTLILPERKNDLPLDQDYRVVCGCLELHVRSYICCGRHTEVFRDMYKQIFCPDCEPGHYLAEVMYQTLDK